jgi:predicted alpha/beta superfamily hydrolase
MHRPVFGEVTQVRFVVVIDGWPEKGRPLQRIAPNVYAASGPFRSGSWVEYKFLREACWETVEKGDDNREIANRRLTVKTDVRDQLVLHRVVRWADRPRLTNTSVEFNEPGASGPLVYASTLTGDIRTHHLFHSPELRNARTIMVYLPPGYDDALDERYPVLYMHDGNNVFDARTSAAGVEWGVDETAQALITQGRIRGVIVVAIFNTPQRTKEYTPFEDSEYGGGLGDAYLEFICATLKPFIDKTYRTLPQREHTGLAGSSLGGLISLYGLFKRADAFGFAGAVSPALWWSKRKIFSFIRHAPRPPSIRLWLDMGTEEGEPAGPLVEYKKGPADCRRLVKALTDKGYRPEGEVHYEEVEGGRHHELDWAARVDRMLLYFFGAAVADRTKAVGAKEGEAGE